MKLGTRADTLHAESAFRLDWTDRTPRQGSSSQLRRHFPVTTQEPAPYQSETARLESGRVPDAFEQDVSFQARVTGHEVVERGSQEVERGSEVLRHSALGGVLAVRVSDEDHRAPACGAILIQYVVLKISRVADSPARTRGTEWAM